MGKYIGESVLRKEDPRMVTGDNLLKKLILIVYMVLF